MNLVVRSHDQARLDAEKADGSSLKRRIKRKTNDGRGQAILGPEVGNSHGGVEVPLQETQRGQTGRQGRATARDRERVLGQFLLGIPRDRYSDSEEATIAFKQSCFQPPCHRFKWLKQFSRAKTFISIIRG